MRKQWSSARVIGSSLAWGVPFRRVNREIRKGRQVGAWFKRDFPKGVARSCGNPESSIGSNGLRVLHLLTNGADDSAFEEKRHLAKQFALKLAQLKRISSLQG